MIVLITCRFFGFHLVLISNWLPIPELFSAKTKCRSLLWKHILQESMWPNNKCDTGVEMLKCEELSLFCDEGSIFLTPAYSTDCNSSADVGCPEQ